MHKAYLLLSTVGTACCLHLPHIQHVDWLIHHSAPLCPFDAVEVGATWTVFGAMEMMENAILEVVDTRDENRVLIDSSTKLNIIPLEPMTINDDHIPIKCEFDPAFCIPKVESMLLPNRPDGYLMPNDIIDISFESATNMPPVLTKAELVDILDFPDDLGSELEGEWTTPKNLQIRVVSTTNEVWIKNITKAPSVKVHDNPYYSWKFKSKTIHYRFGFPGTYRLRLSIGSLTTQDGLDSPMIYISEACTESKVILSLEHSVDNSLTKPYQQVQGVLSMDSYYPYQLPDSSLLTDNGSWSLVFWLYLNQDSTGHHRTLFYKGPGSNQHRTPSAWLQPNDRKLILRVSTDADMDIGMTSVAELPLHQWVYLAFTFRNYSTQQHDNRTYTYSLYVNGKLDTDMHIHHAVVLPNNGSLYVGGNPWMDGLQGYMSHLQIYSSSLSQAHIQRKYQKSYGTIVSSKSIPGIIAMHYKDQLEPARHQLPYNGDETMALEVDDAPSRTPSELASLGQEYLYGSGEYAQSTTKAKWMLEAAFRQGNYSVVKYLGLIHSYQVDPDIGRALAYYHQAANLGDSSAKMILARRYEQGDGVEMDKEAAVYYFHQAAIDASKAYHARGQQPLHEMNSLFNAENENVAEGQEGEDDKWIQYQKMRADVDHDVDAMVAMGDLYYWGARGCPRDHNVAYRYFSKAAALGSDVAMSAAAGMLLKGEGADQDNETAIELYETAAKSKNVRALNGLGYIYFYGTANRAQNQTMGLSYFEEAAAQHTDGDSIFNAGYCHLLGLGTNKNNSMAIAYFRDAAVSFGHFDSIFELGKIAFNENGEYERNIDDAIVYFRAASAAGNWGRSARQGFNAYLENRYMESIWKYHEVREYGYPIAAGNLAYLYDLTGRNSSQYLMEAKESEASLRLGDCYYYGKCGVEKDLKIALIWYSRASANGLSIGAYNVGYMYENGIGAIDIDYIRAKQYYKRAYELSPTWETWFISIVSIYRMEFYRIINKDIFNWLNYILLFLIFFIPYLYY